MGEPGPVARERSDLRETHFERMCRALTAPDMRKADAVQHREIAATVLFTLTGMTIFAAFSLMVLRQGNTQAASVHAGVCVAYALGFLLVRLGLPTFAMYSNILATGVGIWGAMWFGGGLSAPAVVFVATLPTVGVLSLGKRAGVFGVVLGLAVVLLTVVLERRGFTPRLDPPDTAYRKRIVECVVVVIEMYILSIAFHKLADRAYALLSDKRDELAGLLNSMRQGVMAFDQDGRIAGGYSSQACVIFGHDALEQHNVVDLLFAEAAPYDLEREHLVDWLRTAFALGKPSWPEVLELAPVSRVLYEGTERAQFLKLEVRPVFEGEALARVMMLVTDETAEVRLRKEVDENRADRARSAARLRRLAAAGAHTFVAFLRSSRERLAGMQALFGGADGSLDRADLQQCFRHAHTVRGEARTFDLSELEQPMQELETLMRASLDGANEPSARAQIEELLRQGAKAVDDAERRLVEVSPIGEAVLDQVTVSRTDLDLLTACLAKLGTSGVANEPASALRSVARRLSARPFGELAGQFHDAVPRWAAEREKLVNFEVSGKRCMVEPGLAAALPRALTHLFRNAIAHGIEVPELREERGKSRRGTLDVRAEEHDGELVVTVQDDGAGLDLDALRARALERGVSAENPQELIFEPGISTSAKVDSLSGQGVGMGAARQALLAVGYRLLVESEAGRGTRFVMRPLRVAPAMSPTG